MNISLVHPLYLRYMYLDDFWTDDNARYSDLDLFNGVNGEGKYNNFKYDRVNQSTLSPGDCLYIPSNWWVQLDNRMSIKDELTNGHPLYEKYLPKSEKEHNVKWVEYEYTKVSFLEDEAFDALEEGYGS